MELLVVLIKQFVKTTKKPVKLPTKNGTDYCTDIGEQGRRRGVSHGYGMSVK